MMKATLQQNRIPSGRRHREATTLSFRCKVGLTAAVCAATCVAAFTIPAATMRSKSSSTSLFDILDQQRQRHRGTSSMMFSLPQRTLTVLRLAAEEENAEVTTTAQGAGGGDDAEWKALVAAFQMYKAAYGDLKVPSRFIVPSMPPWPENAWSMKLGQKVAAIRSTGKFVQNNEKRRKQLESLGFLWRLRAASPGDLDGISFDQMYDALVTYRKAHPGGATFSVPSNFVVPDCDPWPQSTRGMPLGKKIVSLQSKAFLKANPGAQQKLEKLGVELEGATAASDSRYDNVFAALKCYKEVYGDLLVPQPFIVPESSIEWPENTWGMRLGARVNAIRSQGTFVNTNPERRQELDSIGFVWSPEALGRGRKRGRRTKAEIEADKAAQTEAGTHLDFSEGDDEIAWETTGSAMENLFGPSFDFGSNDLFNNDSGRDDGPSWGIDGNSLSSDTFMGSKEEALLPEATYVPPKTLGESLSEARARATAVGVIVDVGNDSIIKKGKQMKEVPWFNDDFGEDFVFEDIVEALSIYKSMYGNLSNFTLPDGSGFVVPATESNLFGDEDSSSFDAEASARAAAAIAAFEEDGDLSESEDMIAFEIKRLQQEIQSPVGMQTRAAVATKAKPTTAGTSVWPEHLSGMQLGGIVRRIRDGSLEVKHIPERKKKLDKIGFDWGNEAHFLEIPFEKAMCAFYAYYLIRGDMFVPEDFVMLDEDPWPQALAGYEIGKTVNRIRELQHFLEAYHPEKVSLLRSLDFVWFPTLALPLNPDEEEFPVEYQLCMAIGIHPDMKIPNRPPGLVDKLLADGPFYPTDDPRMYWKRYHNWDYVKDHWYAYGVRDNAFRLRRNGWPLLADEHEEKYGPGLYKQLDALMAELEAGAAKKGGEKVKQEYLRKLQHFRDEIAGSNEMFKDELDALLQKIDDNMLSLMTNGKKVTVTEDKFADSGFGFEVEEEYVEDAIEEELDDDNDDSLDEDGEYDDDLDFTDVEEEEFDFEEELELGS